MAENSRAVPAYDIEEHLGRIEREGRRAIVRDDDINPQGLSDRDLVRPREDLPLEPTCLYDDLRHGR